MKRLDETVLPPAFLSSKQVAQRLNFAEITIRLWRSRGIGPRWIKIGRQIRYSIDDLADYENSLVKVGQ